MAMKKKGYGASTQQMLLCSCTIMSLLLVGKTSVTAASWSQTEKHTKYTTCKRSQTARKGLLLPVPVCYITLLWK